MNKTNFIKLIENYTITSKERINGLYDSLEYLRINNIDGDLVECGVYRGGNILGMMEYCDIHKLNKKIFGYDTFNGMTEPKDVDIDYTGNFAKNIYMSNDIICKCSLDDVIQVLKISKFDMSSVKLIEGDITLTLLDESNLPDKISLLRLDTDWYESTKIELELLYPRLVVGGVLIVDDYGHWQGAKKAVDEYFQDKNIDFEILDYTGIKHIKK